MTDTVWITGASGGLGYALAKRYAAAGHPLILTARSEHALYDIQKELQSAYNVNVTVLPADLREDGVIDRLMNAIEDAGLTVDILINNAGFGDFGIFAEANIQKQQDMVALNVTALMSLCHAVLPKMRERAHGKILNVASIAAFQSGPYMSVYYATKAFVVSFSEAIAKELRGSGITVTALCPGPIKTGFEDAADLKNSKLFLSLPVASAEEVANYAFRATQKGKTIAIHGFFNSLLVFGVRLAPRKLVTSMICRIQGYRTGQDPS